MIIARTRILISSLLTSLLLCVFPAGAAGDSLPAFSSPVSLEEFRQAVDNYTHNAVRQALEQDGYANWNHAWNMAVSGEPDWLEVFLEAVSPGYSRRKIDYPYLLAFALPNNPESVLEILLHTYSLPEICAFGFVEPNFEHYTQLTEAATSALDGVTRPDLAKPAQICSAILKDNLTSFLVLYEQGVYSFSN